MKYNVKIEIDIQKPEQKSKNAEEYWEETILKFVDKKMAMHHFTAQMQDELFAMIAGIPPAGTVGVQNEKSPAGTVGVQNEKSPAGTVGIQNEKSPAGTMGVQNERSLAGTAGGKI